MHKTLFVIALLLPTFALAQEAKSAPTAFTSPQIVAHARLVNQTAPIPTTTIFTPTQTGLYRLSVYATISQADLSSGSSYTFGASYTDDSGAEQYFQELLVGSDNQLGQFSIYLDTFYSSGGPTVTFEAKAGTAITYTFTQYGSPDASRTNLFKTAHSQNLTPCRMPVK